MGACGTKEECEINCKKRATIREVRERLEIIFDRMDQNNEGTVTYGQAMKFLMLSKRDMHKCEKDRTQAVTRAVKKMFACAKAQQCRDHITEDEFIAGYTNVLYPQNLTLIQLETQLRKLFGKVADMNAETFNQALNTHRVASI